MLSVYEFFTDQGSTNFQERIIKQFYSHFKPTSVNSAEDIKKDSDFKVYIHRDFRQEFRIEGSILIRKDLLQSTMDLKEINNLSQNTI
jgi:hypothetical protein